jgi:hypothetical protein
MSEAAMSSFTWKRPRDLETQQGHETPQDLETRYEGADIEPASWFHPQVHPAESRGEYVLLADLCGSDADVERWLQSHAHRPIVAKAYHGAGTPNSLP